MSIHDKQAAEKDLIQSTFRMAGFGVGLAGCVTVLIIGIAVLVGFWLDKTFESAKHLFTLGLLILSLPVNLLAMLWVARYTASRFKASSGEAIQENNLQEDADSV